jgi:hypothetical protein
MFLINTINWLLMLPREDNEQTNSSTARGTSSGTLHKARQQRVYVTPSLRRF